MTVVDHTSLTRQDLQPILDLLEADDPLVRMRALEAITAIPLPEDAWVVVGRIVMDLLDRGAGVDELVAAVRVPVREVRERVHTRLAFARGDERRVLAEALATAHDEAGAGALTELLVRGEPSEIEGAAQALSFVAPARAGLVREVFAAAESDDVRLWLALHLARGGDDEPIQAVLADAAAGRFDPTLYYGDPAVAEAEIRARDPLPDLVVDLARDLDAGSSLLIEHLTHPAAPPTPASPAEPPAAAAVEAAQAVVARMDLDGDASWSDDRNDLWMRAADELAPLLEAVPDAAVAKVVAVVLAAPAPPAAGNLMVQLVAAHAAFEPDIGLAHAAYKRLEAASHEQAEQAAWVASRASLSRVIAETRASLGRDPAGTLEFIRAVAGHSRDPHGPLLGAGSAPPTSAPVIDLISLATSTPRSAAIDDAAGADAFGLESLGPDDVAGADDLGLESLGPDDAGVGEGEEGAEADRVYALLDAPGTVTAGVEFELAVGISPRQSAGVVGGPIVGLQGRPKPYYLKIQVVADGFALRAGESWRQVFEITEAEPYQQATLHLTAEETGEAVRSSALVATYTVDGQVVGTAVRPVAVVAPGVGAQPVEEKGGADISIPLGEVPPDLTIVLHRTRELHLLRMTVESPHESVPIPDEDVEVDIGADPDDYAQQLVRAMDAVEGQPGMWRTLKGKARTLAGSLPSEFWGALRAAAAASQGPPTLLLITVEGRVPWELAMVDPPLDPSLPPFLSTQTVMGRWVLGDTPLPPPHERPVDAMAVVTGDYAGLSRWETLQAAFDERDRLQATYQAEPVEATHDDVIGLLDRDPAPSVLHMAVHGKYSPGTVQEGLVLTDGNWLTPDVVRGEKIAGEPFVFMNACQVGSASEVLSHYSGLAAAFLEAGASGVIAPLWSVKDDIARDIAVGFYAATLDDGLTVGEAIRRERAGFAGEEGGEPVSATFMAYQYFGHPELRLARSDPGDG